VRRKGEIPKERRIVRLATLPYDKERQTGGEGERDLVDRGKRGSFHEKGGRRWKEGKGGERELLETCVSIDHPNKGHIGDTGGIVSPKRRRKRRGGAMTVFQKKEKR